MTIKKLTDGRYEVDIRPAGRHGKRIRRKFEKKFEAVNFERYVMAQHPRSWQTGLTDSRHLSEMIRVWWDMYGKHTEHGRDQRHKMEIICRLMSDPRIPQIDKAMITQLCNARLSQGVKASTINREINGISGMFTYLTNSGMYAGEHPFRGFKKLPEQSTEMSFLTDGEITALLNSLSGDDYNIAVLCLSTGARWGEATRLKREHIIHNKVRFTFTKTGKPRIVPVSEEVADLLCRDRQGLLFPGVSYQRFRKILREVKPTLPPGQAVHSLRHTFATHFMINGGSIITLQRLMGHASIEQTMTYAHFAPDFLQEVITRNPLKGKTRLL